MTIKEKFKDVMYDAITYKQQEDSFMQIADEYAIEFAHWLFEDMEITKVEKLLKLFKQYNKMNLPKEL